jgi:hypothetical protein
VLHLIRRGRYDGAIVALKTELHDQRPPR